MISRSRSAPTAAAMSIECTTSAKKHRDLLVLRRCGRRRDWRTALATELGLRAQFCAARPARQAAAAVISRGQPTVVHVTIVSPLASQHVPYRRCEPANG